MGPAALAPHWHGRGSFLQKLPPEAQSQALELTGSRRERLGSPVRAQGDHRAQEAHGQLTEGRPAH